MAKETTGVFPVSMLTFQFVMPTFARGQIPWNPMKKHHFPMFFLWFSWCFMMLSADQAQIRMANQGFGGLQFEGGVTMMSTNSAISPALLQNIIFFSSMFICPWSSHIVSNCVSSATSCGRCRLYCHVGGHILWYIESTKIWNRRISQRATTNDAIHHSKFDA